jgi:hypothetical protein
VQKGRNMDMNNNILETQEKSMSNKIITQEDIKTMKSGDLLQFLKQFEGSGRSKHFTDDAASYEKKKSGIVFKYDFSWSWLTKQAFCMGIEYSDGDGHWCMRSCDTKPEESTYTIRVQKLGKTKTKKRTIEVDSDTWEKWDKKLGDVPCKAVFYTAALGKFIEDMSAGKITMTFDIV